VATTSEGSKASVERLTRVVLLIAIAYTCAGLFGRKIKQLGRQKYVSRLKELGRLDKRHSSFWVGLYGLSVGRRSGILVRFSSAVNEN